MLKKSPSYYIFCKKMRPYNIFYIPYQKSVKITIINHSLQAWQILNNNEKI